MLELRLDKADWQRLLKVEGYTEAQLCVEQRLAAVSDLDPDKCGDAPAEVDEAELLSHLN